jgi:membrane protein implicated in regulation of membrane protease activity
MVDWLAVGLILFSIAGIIWLMRFRATWLILASALGAGALGYALFGQYWHAAGCATLAFVALFTAWEFFDTTPRDPIPARSDVDEDIDDDPDRHPLEEFIRRT